jgi:hypothetical protein
MGTSLSRFRRHILSLYREYTASDDITTDEFEGIWKKTVVTETVPEFVPRGNGEN